MHRDYETNAPVQFYEYDDRIEVQNPGGLYGKVTPDNFPNVSDYRNPFIAEAMKVLGYVNRFSRGVYRVHGYSGDMHPLIPVKCTHLLNYQFDKVILFFLNCLLLTRFYALCELPCL